MLDELRELYQEVILDHGRTPRNFRRLDGANRHAHGRNPMCGDVLEVFVDLGEDGRIADVAFVGKGCAISIASASLMTETLKGRTASDALRLFDTFHRMCTEKDFTPLVESGIDADAVERLESLSGVREFPIRVKCATLSWHTMKAALTGEADASTE
jgi:nitrogen fixation NifU-like protein